MGLMHHRDGEKKIGFTASKHLPVAFSKARISPDVLASELRR